MRLRRARPERDPIERRRVGAPAAYLDANDPCDVARHLALLDPVPQPGVVRVTVTPTARPSSWWVEVVSRNRAGLLAAITGGLEHRSLEVVSASVATWSDGATLDIFRVDAEHAPDPDDLRIAIEEALGAPLLPSPIVGATVIFSSAPDGSTLCEVRAPDRHGLLHDLAATFALQGVQIDSARVETEIDNAVDRFALTDRRGRPLDIAAQHALRAALVRGHDPRRANAAS